MSSIILQRYDRSRFYVFNEELQDFDILNSKFTEGLIKLDSAGSYQITDAVQHALDLIALEVYGWEGMDWILAAFNKLGSTFELTPGVKLFYPSISDLETLYFATSDELNVFPKG